MIIMRETRKKGGVKKKRGCMAQKPALRPSYYARSDRELPFLASLGDRVEAKRKILPRCV